MAVVDFSLRLHTGAREGGKRERDVWKRGMYRRRRAVVTSATASVLLQWRFLCQKGMASFFLLRRRYPRRKSWEST